MKHLVFFLPVFIILALASCSSTSLIERKYRPGFYFDRKGENRHAAAIPQRETGENVPAEKAEAVEHTSGSFSAERTDTLFSPSTADSSSAKKTGTACKPGDASNPEKEQTAPSQKDKPEKEEAVLVKEAFFFALLSIAFIVALLLLMAVLAMASLYLPLYWGPLVASGFLGLSCASALIGFSKARKVRKNHDKAEEYEGKPKIVFATIAGITWFVLLGAGIVGGLIGLFIALINSGG